MASEQPKKRSRSKKGPLAIGGALLAVGAAGYLALHTGDPEKIKGAQDNTQKKVEDALEDSPSAPPPSTPTEKPLPQLKIAEPQEEFDETDDTDAQEKIDYKGLDNAELLRLAKEGDVEAASLLIDRSLEMRDEIYKAASGEDDMTPLPRGYIKYTHQKILDTLGMTEEEYAAIWQGSAIAKMKNHVYYKENDPLEADQDFYVLARRLDIVAGKNMQFDPLFLKLLGMSKSELQDFIRETVSVISDSPLNQALVERLKKDYGIE